MGEVDIGLDDIGYRCARGVVVGVYQAGGADGWAGVSGDGGQWLTTGSGLGRVWLVTFSQYILATATPNSQESVTTSFG
jgi:hypothetical protein